MLGLMSTEATPASFRALSACEPEFRVRFSVATTLLVEHTRIVKFSSLPYAQSSTADDQDFFYIHKILARYDSSAFQVSFRSGSFLHGSKWLSGPGELSRLLP